MNCWAILDIDSTTDKSTIRRAYARQLKQHRPDEDPQGFRQLREAFEQAQRYAEADDTASEAPPETPQVIVEDASSPATYPSSLQVPTQTAPEPEWHRDQLCRQAEEIADEIVTDEMRGTVRLYHYLEEELPDSLLAQEIFSEALAMALAKSQWLSRSSVEKVATLMDWDLDNYHVSRLPAACVEALMHQVSATEMEYRWLALRAKHQHSWEDRWRWRLISEAGTRLPWWGRLLPDFMVQTLREIHEICAEYPDLYLRLNPEIKPLLQQPGVAVSWGFIITLLFWGAVSGFFISGWPNDLDNPLSGSMLRVKQAGIMLTLVAFCLWGYPWLYRITATRVTARRLVQLSMALLSLALVILPVRELYQYGQAYYRQHHEIPSPVYFCVIMIAFPLGAHLLTRRHQWREWPTGLLIVILMFPVQFMRQLPMLLNGLLLPVSAKFYALIIQLIWFI